MTTTEITTTYPENNAYAKFLGNKQRALWYVMLFPVVVTSIHTDGQLKVPIGRHCVWENCCLESNSKLCLNHGVPHHGFKLIWSQCIVEECFRNIGQVII